MQGFSSALQNFWSYLWQLHNQSKKMIRLDFSDVVESSTSNEEEKEIAREVLGKKGEEETGNGSGGNGSGDNGPSGDEGSYSTRQKIGLGLGPVLFLILFLIPTPEGMSPEAQSVLAGTAWIATWWICESIPIPATSLLPIVIFPVTGAMETGDTTAPYANHLVFLFMGGFMIALAMEKWNLHRRIALTIIKTIGGSPKRIILGFMVATAFLSMWISNTATTMMMTPIGLAVILQFATIIKERGIEGVDVRVGRFAFGTALMLGIAYSASIGGVATLIGTPPNVVFAGIAKELFDQEIAFATWITYGLPLAAIALIVCWYYLTNIAFNIKLKELPGGMQVIHEELEKLGTISREESRVLAVFLLVAILWISRGFFLGDWLPKISDATIAIFGALVLFVIPVDLKRGKFLLDWQTMTRMPWGILILFGGGLSIAAGFSDTGLAEWIAQQLSGLEGANMFIIALSVVALAIFLTEVTSNTATSSMLMPIMASLSVAMGLHPYAMMVTAAIACSFAFMLPVATPPNAIVFGSGYISVPQMAKAGVFMNIFGIILVTLLTLYLMPAVWGLDLTTVPTWAK